mmetsp:Transcript_102070/g.304631  ORF Transcript_102070/g.304631 Transcript_102070/m.304631 type:complete len:256 (+) Transcript_102070:927-1694(+)
MPRLVMSFSTSALLHSLPSADRNSFAEIMPSLLLSMRRKSTLSSRSCARFFCEVTSVTSARYMSVRSDRFASKANVSVSTCWTPCAMLNQLSLITCETVGRSSNGFDSMAETRLFNPGDPSVISGCSLLVLLATSTSPPSCPGNTNGGFPVLMVKSITPIEKTSPRGVQRPCSHTSGGMYPGVPPPLDLEQNLFARPKSITMTCGSCQSAPSATMTLASLRSEWTTPLWWRNSTPRQTWCITYPSHVSSTLMPAS